MVDKFSTMLFILLILVMFYQGQILSVVLLKIGDFGQNWLGHKKPSALVKH